MYLGIRMMFAGFVMLGVAVFFVLNTFVAEIRPSVREATEEVMVDAAHLLAELAVDDLASGHINDGRFAERTRAYQKRSIKATIWGIEKETLDFRVVVTDTRGVVQFDTEGKDIGHQSVARCRADATRRIRRASFTRGKTRLRTTGVLCCCPNQI